MQLDELTLKNYKIHRDLTLKFGPGVTGIVGDNGTGKSSIISAIRFLFTGEVDTDKKVDSITLGETEAWISGTFTLNEKQGSLERHLSTSKVILKYDGKTYNKATEVKELWAELLQIDGSIFNNVIISKQGDTPLLFSGDDTVREKVFQKIFLVPPTEKLRSTIWDYYIKTCPPEQFEENVSLMQSEQSTVATRRNILLAEIDIKAASVLNDATLKCVLERIAFLERCQRDLVIKPQLEAQYKDLRIKIDSRIEQIESASHWLKEFNLNAAKEDYNKLLAQKNLAKHKEDLKSDLELAELRAPAEDILEAIRKEFAEAEAEYTAARDAVLVEENNYKVLTANSTNLKDLEGQTVCPTCGQELKDVLKIAAHYAEQEEEAKRKLQACRAHLNVITKKHSRIQNELTTLEGKHQYVLNLRQQLSRYSDVTYSEEDLHVLEEAIFDYESSANLIRTLATEAAELKGQLNVIAERMKNLAIYDGKETIESELTTMREVVTVNRTRAEELETLRVQEAKFEHELRLLEQRVEISLTNHKANEKRRAYLDKLQKAYEILHVHSFPRQLIQSYSEYVQTYLSKYLEKFNIPYRARIVDGFKIKMVNENGIDLPQVSGGQEVIIGLCLRLALHRMFAQSFPIWIVDEGANYLSESNKKAYFKLIEEIRKNKIINQVIVIDHENQLMNVVDQCISL